MSTYATTAEVKALLPTTRQGSITSDDQIAALIGEASAWVDSVYPRIAPFPMVGDGAFRVLDITDSADIEDTTLTVASLSAAVPAQTELMVSTVDPPPDEDDALLRGHVDIYPASYPHAGIGYYFARRVELPRDYTIYTVQREAAMGATALSIRPALRERVRKRQQVLLGTPPLIRRAAKMMANYWALIAGPNISMGKEVQAYLEEVHRLLQIRKSGSIAYAKPHSAIYYDPTRARIGTA